MKRISKLFSIAAGMAVLTLTTTAAPVMAAPEVCTVEGPNNRMVCKPLTPTTAPATGSSGGSSGGGLMGWIDSHIGTLIVIGLVVIGIAITMSVSKEKAQEKERRESAALARGRQLAQAHHAHQVQAAEQQALAQLPPRESYDPMGMGVPAPAPQVEPPPAPSNDPDDLKRYNTFGAVVPWEPGTAFAAVVDRDGSLARANSAFAEAVAAANLGTEDPETGEFVPDAALTNVRNVAGDADAVELVVCVAGLHVREERLNRLREFLAVAARVETASPFVREASTGRYVTTLTNRAEEKSAPAAQTAPAAGDGPESWEW